MGQIVNANGIRAPVIVGHSMGGVVAQEYVQDPQRLVRGLVLMATLQRGSPLPNTHIVLQLLRVCGVRSLGTGWNFALNTPDAEAMRKLFFSKETTATTLLDEETTMEDYFARLKSRDIAYGPFDYFPRSTRWPNAPRLVVIPQDDKCIPVKCQHKLAKSASADILEISRMAHCLGETGWEKSVAAPVISWLDKNIHVA